VNGTTSIGELADGLEYRLADWDPVPSEAGERRGEPNDDALIVSVRGDASVGLRLRATEMLLFTAAALLFAVTMLTAGAAARPANSGAASWLPWLFGAMVVVGLAAVPAVLIPSGYRVIAVRRRAALAWQSIDQALARRALLVPPLTFVVRSGAPDEVEMITLMQSIVHRVHLRTPSLADRIELVPLLVALTERQPQLRAVPNFDALMTQLQLAEDQVTLGQSFFNDAVDTGETLAGTFPGSFVTRLGPTRERLTRFDWYTPSAARVRSRA
jgi:hypothetical protein